MKKIADVITDPIIFLEDIFALIEESNLDVSDCLLDHLCYRVATVEEYEEKKLELAELGELLIESMVNGRLIATYKLYSPILFRERKIDVLELPSPKPGKKYSSGLEHIEFVTSKELFEIVNLNPHLYFETEGINKKNNADITLRLGNYCIRFHRQTLEEVIIEEKTCQI